jgi:hypothetical protein
MDAYSIEANAAAAMCTGHTEQWRSRRHNSLKHCHTKSTRTSSLHHPTHIALLPSQTRYKKQADVTILQKLHQGQTTVIYRESQESAF